MLTPLHIQAVTTSCAYPPFLAPPCRRLLPVPQVGACSLRGHGGGWKVLLLLLLLFAVSKLHALFPKTNAVSLHLLAHCCCCASQVYVMGMLMVCHFCSPLQCKCRCAPLA